MIKWIKKMFIKPRRLDLVKVPYCHADDYLKSGWTIAKEEDTNSDYGRVYLELLEK